MAATCAACMRPITSRTQLVVMETEVLHKRCVGQITELWRIRQQAAALATTSATEDVLRKREIVAVREQLFAMHVRAIAAEYQLDSAVAMRDSLTSHNAELRRDMAALRAEMAPRPPPLAAAAIHVTPEHGGPADDLDSASMRFAMMELD